LGPRIPRIPVKCEDNNLYEYQYLFLTNLVDLRRLEALVALGKKLEALNFNLDVLIAFT
jgi:hypothetical protein